MRQKKSSKKGGVKLPKHLQHININAAGVMPVLEAWSGDCDHIIGEASSYPVCKSTQCITPYCPAAFTVSWNIKMLS
jgi:hypothetical protein